MKYYYNIFILMGHISDCFVELDNVLGDTQCEIAGKSSVLALTNAK